MKAESVWKRSFHTLTSDWKIWLILLLSVGVDLYAVLTFSPNWVDVRWINIVLLVFTALLQALLIKMIAGHLRGTPHRFKDDVSTVLGSIPRILGAKILIFLMPMACYALFMIFSVIITSYTVIQVGFIALFIPILLFVEVWNFYSCAIILIQNFSATDALSLSLQAIWSEKKKIFIRLFPFFFFETVLILILLLMQAITKDSAFTFTVTRDMAFQYAGESASSYKLTVAGDYFVLNRIMNGIITALVKINGMDILSAFLYTIRDWVIGVIVVLVSIPLTGIKITMMTSTYIETAGDSISLGQENWKFKEEVLKAGRKI